MRPPRAADPAEQLPKVAQRQTTVPTAPLTSPDNPLFWFGVFTAVTLGLVGASTQLKFGPIRLAASAGDT
jgi:hypothetical protein